MEELLAVWFNISMACPEPVVEGEMLSHAGAPLIFQLMLLLMVRVAEPAVSGKEKEVGEAVSTAWGWFTISNERLLSKLPLPTSAQVPPVGRYHTTTV